MPGEWKTTREIADELGVSDDTVRRYIAEGWLRAQAIIASRHARVTLRVHQRDLDAFRVRYVRDTSVDVGEP